jgi:hypothetical protein
MSDQKKNVLFEGKLYYSVVAAAKIIGTTSTKLKKIMTSVGLEVENFRVNGPLWISTESLVAYQKRQDQTVATPPFPSRMPVQCHNGLPPPAGWLPTQAGLAAVGGT